MSDGVAKLTMAHFGVIFVSPVRDRKPRLHPRNKLLNLKHERGIQGCRPSQPKAPTMPFHANGQCKYLNFNTIMLFHASLGFISITPPEEKNK